MFDYKKIPESAEDDRSRKAVEVAERFAEGEATKRELSQAQTDAQIVWNELASAKANVTEAEMDAADAASRTAGYAKLSIGAANRASQCAAYAVSYEGQQVISWTIICKIDGWAFSKAWSDSRAKVCLSTQPRMA